MQAGRSWCSPLRARSTVAAGWMQGEPRAELEEGIWCRSIAILVGAFQRRLTREHVLALGRSGQLAPRHNSPRPSLNCPPAQHYGVGTGSRRYRPRLEMGRATPSLEEVKRHGDAEQNS